MSTIAEPTVQPAFTTIDGLRIRYAIDSGHFTWEEDPDTYGDLVASWWSHA